MIAGPVPAVAERLFGDRLQLAEAFADCLATTAIERGLLGPREIPRLWERHLLNCVVVQELLPPRSQIADVGSGAGLPGLVLAIARPDLQVTLVEPLLRRTTWLTETIERLGIDGVEVSRDRAEAVAGSNQRFDAVTARAVAPLPRLVAWCLPLLRSGGELLALKGASAAGELAATDPDLRARDATASVVKCGAKFLATPTVVVRVRKSD